MLIALGSDELQEAGRVAEDVFVLQMRRRRAALGLSQAELADRVTKLGGNLYQQTIAKIESGNRAVRLQEADLIAKALNCTVTEMLATSIGDPASNPETMDIEELISRIRAASRRRDGARQAFHEAAQREGHAREEAAAAQERATYLSHETMRARQHLEEAEREVRELSRISLRRQSELNAKHGPNWQQKLSYKPPISVAQLTQSQQEYLDNLRELAESPGIDNEQHRAIMREVEELESRLEGPENE